MGPCVYDLIPMRWLADLVYLVAGLLYLPVALYNALIVGKNRRGWSQRFGFVPRCDAGRERIWIHAVSLGEINATPKLVEELHTQRPGCDIVFSTTTDTGYARAVQLYGSEHVFRFPLDFSLVISRVLRRIDPTLIVLVELELWYNLVRMSGCRGIPVAVINGRLTERSARKLNRLGPIVRSMFAELAWVGAQDEKIAARFVSLGAVADRVHVTSSLKWDTATVCDSVDGADALARELGIDRTEPLWVCGSTGADEETLILSAYRRLLDDWPRAAQDPQGNAERDGQIAGPTLAIIPRKPERFDEVARLIEQAGFRCVRRSRPDRDAESTSAQAPLVILGDTMGELRKFYSLADAVFVGRTLVPLGGSDPMEIAALAKPVIVGPYTDNFQLPIEALRKADALRIVDSAEALPATVAALLLDRAEAQRLSARARQVVIENQGATKRTVDRLVDLLDSAHHSATGIHAPVRAV